MSPPPKQDQGNSSDLSELPTRVAVHLEEAPAFHFLSRGSASMIPSITWHQGDRLWTIRGDSEHGFGGATCQRLWLALCSLYDHQCRHGGEDGVVHYSKGLLCERMRMPRSGNSFRALDVGLIQLDALRIYIRGGRPLPGPDADKTRALPDGEHEYLYAFLGGEGINIQEEASSPRGQLYLFQPRGGRRRSKWSRRTLSRYVTASLNSGHARTIEDFVFDLRSGWAVRLVRLLGKRAYGDERLTISLAALLPVDTRTLQRTSALGISRILDTGSTSTQWMTTSIPKMEWCLDE